MRGAYASIPKPVGPAVPPIESMREMLPKDHLWPIDDWWNYHAGGGEFKDIHVFTDALNGRYGNATGLEDYTLKSQLMDTRVSALCSKPIAGTSTHPRSDSVDAEQRVAVVIWHLYDFYLRPAEATLARRRRWSRCIRCIRMMTVRFGCEQSICGCKGSEAHGENLQPGHD